MHHRRRKPRDRTPPSWGHRPSPPVDLGEGEPPCNFGPAPDRRRRRRGRFVIEWQWKSWRSGGWGRWTVRSRYRDEAESRDWEDRDPLLRIRRLLAKAGGWTEEWQADLETRASQEIEEAVEWAENVPEPTSEQMVGRVFAERPQSLTQQLSEAGDE